MKFLQKKNQRLFAFLLLLIGIVMMTYHGVFFTFYQQDEWQTLGYNIVKGIGGALYDVEVGQNPLRLFFAEGRILSVLVYFILYGIKKFSVTPIFIFGLITHITNAFLVYILVRKISRTFITAFFASIFFAVNSVGSQAVTWAAAVGTLPATALLLLSFIWYVDFLETNNRRKRNIAFFVCILSLFFKETGLFLFLFYPLLYAWWKKTKNIKEVLSIHTPLLLYGVGLFAFRLGELIFAPVTYAGFVDNQKGDYLFSVVYHMIVYPLTSLVQAFVTPQALYAFVPRVVRSEYAYLVGTPLFDLVGQSAVADVVSLVGTILLLVCIGCMVLGKKEEERNKKFVFVGFLLFFFSFMPYAVLHRFFSYMSSRYYYVGIVGAACLFGYIVSWIYKRVPPVPRVLLVVSIGFYFFYHAQTIQKDLDAQVAIAKERKTFLSEVKRVHPTLENKTVFYITSDKKYLGEITYPFQNGLGYILEVLYFDTGKIPKTFISSNFLWDLGSEGYRTQDGYSFGYFEHLDGLAKLVEKKEVTPEIVYGHFYDSKIHTMVDITNDVRLQLATLSALPQ